MWALSLFGIMREEEESKEVRIVATLLARLLISWRGLGETAQLY
jgi:hypothetical protein